MLIKRKSPFSGKVHIRNLDVSEDEMMDWKSGTCIQDALVNLNAEDREFVKTGITPEEWDETFSPDEEEAL
jgi:hypothetical protein